MFILFTRTVRVSIFFRRGEVPLVLMSVAIKRSAGRVMYVLVDPLSAVACPYGCIIHRWTGARDWRS